MASVLSGALDVHLVLRIIGDLLFVIFNRKNDSHMLRSLFLPDLCCIYCQWHTVLWHAVIQLEIPAWQMFIRQTIVSAKSLHN